VKKQVNSCEILIIGAGIIGISIGNALLEINPRLKILIVDKERFLGAHASGRNSGVIHAGFYYSPDSLKARFCRIGNVELRRLCKQHKIPILNSGKVVVTKNKDEDIRLTRLFERGVANGVDLEILDAKELRRLEPLASTNEKFIWSPTTAVSNPQLVLEAMAKEFSDKGGRILFENRIEIEENGEEVFVKGSKISANFIVNAAGAHADYLSRSIGVGNEYAMIPFKGVYRSTSQHNLPLQRLVYPVPHPINPFLGVHFTLTTNGLVKIGPTAIPVSGRERYSFSEGWSFSDAKQALKGTTAMLRDDPRRLGGIIKDELPKLLEFNLVAESALMVKAANNVKEWERRKPGIRAQLVHLPSGQLEQDFVIKAKYNSLHILNAVSPGWTSAIPFGRYISNIVLPNI
jgi:L-2-hydroxyglutarate oxidase LhgO